MTTSTWYRKVRISINPHYEMYNVELWRIWWPFWVYKTSEKTVEEAEAAARKVLNPVVKIV